MGKLNLWAGISGVRQLQGEHAQQMKNREAEDSYVRRHVWDEQGKPDEPEHEDMGDTILGDVTHPTPIVVPPQKSSGLLPLIAGAALGSLIPAAGLVGYSIAKPDQPAEVVPAVPTFEDSSVSIGLGRIEDYLKQPATNQ